MRKISNGLVCENGNQPGFFLRSRWCRCRCGCLTSLLLKLTSDAEANQKKDFLSSPKRSGTHDLLITISPHALPLRTTADLWELRTFQKVHVTNRCPVSSMA